MRFVTRKPRGLGYANIDGGGGGISTRFRPQRIAASPPPLERATSRVWWKDRDKLDLGRRLPPGSVTTEELERIDPGFFLAWNLILFRWEVWCSREVMVRGHCKTGTIDYLVDEPYYVMRVCLHPRKIDHLGNVIQVCTAIPKRYKNCVMCPPSCPGVYQIPSRKLLGVLWMASYLHQAKSPEEVIAGIEDREHREAMALERHFTQTARDIWGEKFNQLFGIKSVAVPG